MMLADVVSKSSSGKMASAEKALVGHMLKQRRISPQFGKVSLNQKLLNLERDSFHFGW